MSKIGDYIKETRAELSHVSWPSRKQTAIFTFLVIVFSFGVAFYLGFFDYLFSLGIRTLIS
jgi:preprotein translocase subunit SecE